PLHLGEDEARDPVPLALTRLSNAVAVIGRNVDRRARHELARCILDELRRDRPRHAGPPTLAYYIAVVSARRLTAVGNEPPGAVRGGEAAQAEDHERPAPGCGERAGRVRQVEDPAEHDRRDRAGAEPRKERSASAAPRCAGPT